MISRPQGIVHRLKHRRVGSFEEWRAYEAQTVERRRRIQESEAALPSPPPVLRRDGICHVCRERTHFTYSTENLREDLVCEGCNLINRLRASVWLFEVECRPRRGSAIYLTEQVTQLYAVLAKRYSKLQGSEYLGSDVPLGEVANGVRNESLTELTFDSGSFSGVLSFECFEHIPDYGQAFRECARVLRPGGRMVFSVPFLRDAESTLVRARIRPDGEIEHILEPEYHGDPLTNDGCLCFQHFGWDILDALREAGFSRAWACVYWSQRYAYLGAEQIQFVAVR